MVYPDIIATPVLVMLLVVYRLLQYMSNDKFMLPFISRLKCGEVIAPNAVRVRAPNPQMKPAKPVHAPMMDSAKLTEAFVPLEPKFTMMLLSWVWASLVKPLQYDNFDNVTPFSAVLKFMYKLLSTQNCWLKFIIETP